MFQYLPIMILAGFMLEIASIIWIGGIIGVLPTILLLIAGVAAGVSVFKSAGSNAAAVLRSSIQDPRTQRNLAGATMARVMAGVLFAVPGFFSDLAAIALLLPPVQAWIARRFKLAGFEARYAPVQTYQRGTVIEGEAIEIEGEIVSDNGSDDRRAPF